MKKKNILNIIWTFSLIITSLGTTFSYFTANRSSNSGVVSAMSTMVGINLSVSPIYNSKPLIPMNDEDLGKAYENQCVDLYNYGACQAYNIEIENIGEQMVYQGTIKFDINHIVNLNYKILDEDGNTYVEGTRIISDTDQTLGNEFTLAKDEVKNFILLIWLSNYDYDQVEDVSGGYNAYITYESTNGSVITGSIAGS